MGTAGLARGEDHGGGADFQKLGGPDDLQAIPRGAAEDAEDVADK